jgi:hypothetical protein
MESKKVEPIGAESGMMVTRGWKAWGKGIRRCQSKDQKIQLGKRLDLMIAILIIGNNKSHS